MSQTYQPPYAITPTILSLVSEISEWIGRYSVTAETTLTPILRRGNRIRSIQASLAIENNTLNLEQVTAIIEGKRVLGNPREIQEVLNAFAAYETMDSWNPTSSKDLLAAHAALMSGLVEQAGKFRIGAVGIVKGERVVHIAPPAQRVPVLINDLLSWLKTTDAHPLITNCVFHYEFEFIHPFPDGNGRMGRLWQTLILSKWKPLLAYLPIESLVRDQQDEYYRVLAVSDKAGNSTAFIEFLLSVILETLQKSIHTDQAIDQVADQVNTLLQYMEIKGKTALQLMAMLGLSHRQTFRSNYLHPALDGGLIERTLPEKPNSPLQKYRLTPKGLALKQKFQEGKSNH